MKLAIIGGGGIRVPLLVHGLIRRGLAITDVALFDIDASRVAVMSRLAQARTADLRLTPHADVESCVDGADFVVTSLRVGGLAARQHDETVSLAHGLVGTETVGPGGFAMAVRTIPELCRYAEIIERHAREAWVINFTNPVGLVTQAMLREADLKVVGICDTPIELFAEIAHALGVPLRECAFDYIGLNHLGWVREVYHQGRPLLEHIWDNVPILRRVYSRPLFPAEYLSDLRLLPTEYAYYYAFPERAVANLRQAGRSRGEVVSQLTDRLFATLDAEPEDAVPAYERYLAERSASYMQLEAGQAAPRPASPWAELTGYDRIAFDVMHAIVGNTNAVIPLDVENRSNIPDLQKDDVIEVPCAVGANGPRALHVGALPPQIRDLVLRVKEYERLTIDATFSGERDALVNALAHNPLVPSREVASTLVDQLTL